MHISLLVWYNINMINSRAIVGFFVILIIIVGSIVFLQRNKAWFTNLGKKTTTSTSATVTPGANPGNGEVSQAGLQTCSAEFTNKTCSAYPAEPVCGWERVVGESGEETVRTLNYTNACSYCKLYGESKVLDLGDAKYYPLGYTAGSCVAPTGTSNTK